MPARFPSYDLPKADVPEGLARSHAPRLPEISGSPSWCVTSPLSPTATSSRPGFYPLGSCTMKHNPRVNERAVNLPGFRDLHPLQEEEASQGALELMWRLQEILAEVCGLHAVLAAAGGRVAG